MVNEELENVPSNILRYIRMQILFLHNFTMEGMQKCVLFIAVL